MWPSPVTPRAAWQRNSPSRFERCWITTQPAGGSDGSLLVLGQQLLVPRKDGILCKVTGSGDTSVAAIVKQFDNVTTDAVLDYKPNAIADAASLKTGDFVLLPAATAAAATPAT